MYFLKHMQQLLSALSYFQNKIYINLHTLRVNLELMSNGLSNEVVLLWKYLCADRSSYICFKKYTQVIDFELGILKTNF
jgi:hypothetical protein